MSADHDPNLSLFGDLPPPPAPPAPEKPKRTRVTRTAKNVAPDAVGPETNAQAQSSSGDASTPVGPAAAPEGPAPLPQRRRRSPWAAHLASQSTAPLASALTPKPHVLMVITKGEMGGAQNHILTLCTQLQDKVNLRVVIGGAAGSWLEHQLSALGVSCHALPEMVETLWPW
ncbi:MAG: hypothetical protein FGM28_01535, partial [Limnohabitans sp.]|nr:hypothetical protein [Limnohabitans sp.]